MLKLNHALHTPDLTANLISVGCFNIANFSITFGNGHATFNDPAGAAFMAGECSGSMYKLTLTDPIHAMAAKLHEKPVDLEVWHHRFGHASVCTIHALTKLNLLDGLKVVSEIDLKGTCEDCIYRKHTARLYDKVFDKETELLEHVHVDIFVMLNNPSFGGAVYMMLVTDSASSVKHGYFITHKSTDITLQALKDYVAEAKTQTGKKLKSIWIDMGKEWINDKWDVYLHEKGIKMSSGAPYVHGQNGVAECSIRTVIERVHCMLTDSSSPKGLWAKAATTAIYLDNFIPSARHPGVIPWERWTGKYQDISHLRPFSCTAYAKIAPEIGQSKLLPCSVKYSLVGYFGRSAYKLYDAAMCSIIKCHDVIFDEGKGHRMPSADYDNVLIPDSMNAEPVKSTSTTGILRLNLQTVLAARPCITDPPLHPMQLENAAPTQPLPIVPVIPGPVLPPPVRRSTRISKPTQAIEASHEYAACEADAENEGEAWVQAAHVLSATIEDNLPLSATPSNISLLINNLNVHLAFMSAQPDSYVPRSYKEAMQHPDLWKAPMDAELDMLLERDIFKWVEQPPNAHIIDCKWVFANKYNAGGLITKRKARVVVRGFNQIPGLDFNETYTLVVRMESFRMTVAIAASLGYSIWGRDIVAAYLYALTRFTIHVWPIQGTTRPPGLDPMKKYVWVLNKSLYGTMDGKTEIALDPLDCG